MKLRSDGYWEEFETKIGEVKFTDPNAEHVVSVITDGEFWRVVNLRPNVDLTPAAAREVAALLQKAADTAEQEQKLIDEVYQNIDEGGNYDT